MAHEEAVVCFARHSKEEALAQDIGSCTSEHRQAQKKFRRQLADPANKRRYTSMTESAGCCGGHWSMECWDGRHECLMKQAQERWMDAGDGVRVNVLGALVGTWSIWCLVGANELCVEEVVYK